MYGTVARLRVKPGMDEEFLRIGRDATTIPGLVFEHIYRLDAAANEYLLVVGFASKEAYRANAASPEQHARYERYRALLAADPEWNDGEVVFSHPG